MCEAAFLVLSCYLLVIHYPAQTPASSPLKSQFGALYQNLREQRPAIWTSAFHNLRVLVLVPLLVFLSGVPLGQSIAYSAASAVGLVWDLAVQPYDSRVVAGQVLMFGTAKTAAGIGYILMNIPGVGNTVGDVAAMCELAVFLVGMSSGLGLALGKTAYDTVMKVKEWATERGTTRVSAANEGTVIDGTQNSILTHSV